VPEPEAGGLLMQNCSPTVQLFVPHGKLFGGGVELLILEVPLVVVRELLLAIELALVVPAELKDVQPTERGLVDVAPPAPAPVTPLEEAPPLEALLER
jgi:hypothetical protein